MPLRKVAADSSVLLSAICGKAALRIFTRLDLEVLTTEFNIAEIEEYIPRMTGKYNLVENNLHIALSLLPLIRKEESYYKSSMAMAAKHLRNRDPEDIHLAALAFKENVPIWSNDKDFNVLPITIYPTARLLKLFQM